MGWAGSTPRTAWRRRNLLRPTLRRAVRPSRSRGAPELLSLNAGAISKMRIFYAAGSRPNGALSESSIWRANLYMALVSLGHHVVEFDFDLAPYCKHADLRRPEDVAFVAANQSLLETALLEQVALAHAQEPLQLLFTYFYSAFVRPETIKAIGDMGIATVNWYCNASYQFDLVSEIAPAYSYCLVPEKFRLDDYRAVGARPIYCQEAANPDLYKPLDIPHDYDITFIGAAYGDRPDYLRALLDADLDAHAWGPGWSALTPVSARAVQARRALGQAKRRLLGRPLRPPLARQSRLPRAACGGVLSDDDMVSMFSRSRICLGFSSVGDTARSTAPIRQVRLRDFEVPMAGAFYMLEYVDEIEEFFVPGEEIVCFQGPDDLVEKARYYLTHEEEREAIRTAGHERARRDHTWQKRLSHAFAQMGLA